VFNKELRVLVTGVGGPAGRAVVHFLKGNGFFILGTDMRDVETEATVFCKVLPALHPSYISELLNLIDKYNISLLIPTVTEELVYVSMAKNRIRRLGCFLFIPSYKYTKIANDKFLTAIFLKKKGIDTPKTVLRESLNSLDELEGILSWGEGSSHLLLKRGAKKRK